MGLRCYGLSSPRNDGKVSVRFTNVEDQYHEWIIDELPWDAAKPVLPGENHADVLDQHLIDAITQRALPEGLGPKAQGALVAFLYMYMSISHKGSQQRCIYSSFILARGIN